MANATATVVLRMGQFTTIGALIGPLLREEELNLDPQLPGGRLAWPDDVVERLELRVHRQRAELARFSAPGSSLSRNSLPPPAPRGTVHLSPLLATQLAVRMGALTRYQPSPKL